MADSCVSLLESIPHLIFHPFVLSLVGFNHLILLLQLLLKLFGLVLELADNRVVSLLYILNIGCMNAGDSFLDVVKLKLILSLHHVYLLSQHAHFSLQVGSFLGMLLCLPPQAGQ
jgi:hypothetical protein